MDTKKKNRLCYNYKRHGYKEEDKLRSETFRTECKEAVGSAKLSYLAHLGSKLNEPDTTSKHYWKIIHRVMNKCRTPKIPHTLNFVLSFNLYGRVSCIDIFIFLVVCVLIISKGACWWRNSFSTPGTCHFLEKITLKEEKNRLNSIWARRSSKNNDSPKIITTSVCVCLER